MSYELPSLCGAYRGYFDIGAAISPHSITKHAELLKKHFNSITCENQMKYSLIQPEEGKWNFGPADLIVNFAKENGMRVRGHAPVWHNQTPDWFFKAGDRPAPRELVYERMEQHIKTVAEHFGDDVYVWDVVNEATVDTQDPRHLQRYGLETYRQSNYLTLCGIEYLEKSFHLMRKYSPNSQLCYNDYNECDPLKRERIYNLMKNLLDRGAPLQVCGMQNHFNLEYPPVEEIKISIEKFASLGLRLHITEMDINFYATRIGNEVSYDAPPPGTVEKHAELYTKIFELYRSYKDVIDSVTFWGPADDSSWLSRRGALKNWPLFFDHDHNPKPFVKGIVEAALAGK